MKEQLTVAAVQPVWAGVDVPANVGEHVRAIERADARLVVFPEFSLTGYDLDAPALTADDDRLRPLVDACRVAGSVALVGAPIRDEDGLDHIATLAVTGDGVTVAYRKMWLHGAEFDRFSPGERPVVVTVDGWRLGLAICYDAAVPQHAADSAALGIDAYVASALYGPGADSAARRDSHVRERATAHGIWVVLATAAGPSGSFAQTSGGSGIWGRNGEPVAQAGRDPGETATARLG